VGKRITQKSFEQLTEPTGCLREGMGGGKDRSKGERLPCSLKLKGGKGKTQGLEIIMLDEANK